MTYSVLIAAPFLIAAIAGAVRFVGCTQDFDQFDPQPGDGNGDGDGHEGGKKLDVSFSGSGTVSVKAAFPASDPITNVFDQPGTSTYQIPYWCNVVDLFLLGGGGGGSGGVPTGLGGQGGSWTAVSLWRGPGDAPPDTIAIPATTATIDITVGPGGSGGTNPVVGGNTSAAADGMPPQEAPGGAAAAGTNDTGTGPVPGQVTLHNTQETGGADQTIPGGVGNSPGGGGAGGFLTGGNGADGAAWAVARQI